MPRRPSATTTSKKICRPKPTALEAETHLASRKADRYDLSEVFLEIALVITSITLLSKKRGFLVWRHRSWRYWNRQSP